jgi:UDP-2,4-diacetamido-2,4,6-trideoxy-beta-L-altropyranose hydrolase
MRTAFRVDASVEMGTGHLRRCISLAEAVRQGGGEVAFVTAQGAIASIPPAFEHYILPLTQNANEVAPGGPPHSAWLTKGWADDAADTIAALKNWQPDWVVTDHYGIDARWHDAVRTAFSCQMAAIDDLGDRRHGVDVLIDHNWHEDHRAKYHDLLPEQCQILGGPEYALLGNAYATTPRYVYSPKVRSIGVFLGGTDHLDQTSVVLDCIAAAGFTGSVEIATTSSNPNLAKLKRRVGANDTLSLLVDAPDLAQFFARHDVQIGAGGGATWERFCIGAPSILISFADNHDNVLLPLEREAVAVVLPFGWKVDTLSHWISMVLQDKDLRFRLAERSQKWVDGRGAARIAAALRLV